MKNIQLVFAILFFMAKANSQAILNTALLGTLNPYPTHEYSSIWGYTDSQGREYAILGVDHGTSIIDITNPAQPVQCAFIPGPSSIWREMKVHSHYAYIVTEGTGSGKGLQIVDLSQLPVTATLVNTVTTWFQRAHNITIDNGYAYIVGTDGGGGMHILDLSNPVNPVRTAYYMASGYIHDIYVYNDTVYASSEDTYDVINVVNKNNPQLVSQSAALPGIYAHSGWLTKDKRYFVAAEEFNVRDLTVWDLVDRTTWNLVVPQWQMPGTSPIHNIHIRGDYAHISYYKEGYVCLDVSNPLNPVKVGQYDTYPSTTGPTYDGAWGAFCYFPSGNIIISDISTGLYVIDFLLDNTVPVELTSFSGFQEGDQIILKWETASETNNKGFAIQLSGDEKNWHNIGFINGKGTTTERNSSNFSYRPAKDGLAFYRLAQYDFDGKVNYSATVRVDYLEGSTAEGFRLAQNYPNPFNPSTNIEFVTFSESVVKLEIYDVLGSKVGTLTDKIWPAGRHKIVFDASQLTGGVYFYEISVNGKTARRKMLLNK